MKRWGFLLSLWLCLPNVAHALEVRAYVDRTDVRVSESVALSVVVEGADADADVDVSLITDFKVTSRGSSTTLRIVNFEKSKETTYRYGLFPLKTGRLRIPPLKVRAGKRTAYTREIPVSVSDAADSAAGAGDVYVKASVSKTQPYLGQPFIYTFLLFHAVAITDATLEQPEFEGFSAQQIAEERRTDTVVSGRRYHVIEVKYALIPMKAGRQDIGPSVLNCKVVREDRGAGRNFDSFFDDPFFGRADLEQRMFRTETVPVEVRALPPYAGPGTFSGLVGDFAFSADVDRGEMAVGDSATLSLSVSGRGNIMDAGEPEIEIPEDRFKVYRDNPEEDIGLDENGYFGKKVFRLALVPVKAGKSVLGPFALTCFNPEISRYETIATRSFPLEVSPAAAGEQDRPLDGDAAGPPPDFRKHKVEFVHRDILPLKEGLDALNSHPKMSVAQFIVLLLMPAMAYAAGRLLHLHIHRVEDNTAQMVRRARAAIKDAEKHSSDDDRLLSGLYGAVVSMVLSLADLRGETITAGEIEHIFETQGLPHDVMRRAVALLNDIEACRYGGRRIDTDVKKRLLSEIKKLSRRLL